MPTTCPHRRASIARLLNGIGGRRGVGLLLAVVATSSGCNAANRFSAPRPLQGIASATPLPASFSQPPVEPPPPAPAASVVVETPQPDPPPPLVVAEASPTASLKDEVEQLRAELAALKKHQDNTQSALESMTASSLATANRAAAIEAHLALQSSLIDDLRTAAQQQQREQWKALDAVSEGIDRMLKRSGQDPVGQPPHASPVPAPSTRPSDSFEDIPLEEILSQEPGDSGRKLR
jgi:hypothetical protein